MNNEERARVLVIDNDPQVGADLIEILTPLGLTVEFLYTDGLEQQAALEDEVARCAQRLRPHVAVIDLRLLDDYNPDARAAFALLPHLESARCILYSAYLDNSVTRRARQSDVADWISKASAPSDLVQAVLTAAHRQSPRVNSMTIHWPADWDPRRLLRGLTEDEHNDAPETLLDDVVAQLAVNRSIIELQNMGKAERARPAASRGRSAVMQIKIDDLTPNVLKLAKAGSAKRETENFETHVNNRLAGVFYTRLLGHAIFWDVGGSVYSFVGTGTTSLPTFSEFYRATAEPEEILAPLRDFFTKVWAQHYSAGQSLARLSLAELYDHAFKLENKIARLTQANGAAQTQLTPAEISCLRQWLESAKAKYKAVLGCQAVTHGDFHGDNIFTDGAHLWVIDFERTGIHHALLDFVELEVDILTRVMDGDHFEITLEGPNLVDAKALHVVKGLRQLASEACSFPPEEYLLGVLYDALYVAMIEPTSPQQRQRALRLCHALAQTLELG